MTDDTTTDSQWTTISAEEMQAMYAEQVGKGKTTLTYEAWSAQYLMALSEKLNPRPKKAKLTAKKKKSKKPPKDPILAEAKAESDIAHIRAEHPDWTGEQCWAERDRLREIDLAAKAAENSIEKRRERYQANKAKQAADALKARAKEQAIPKKPVIKQAPKPSAAPTAKSLEEDKDTKLASGLSHKEEMFGRYWAVHGNAAKAAREAGYSAKAAKEIGYRLLTKDHIQEFIHSLTKPMHQKLEITAERTLQEIGHMAYASIGSFLKRDPITNGAYLSVDDATEDQLRGLQALEIVNLPPVTIGTGEDGEELEREVLKTKITLNKVPALGMLAKHFKLIGGDMTITIDQMDKMIALLEAQVGKATIAEEETKA